MLASSRSAVHDILERLVGGGVGDRPTRLLFGVSPDSKPLAICVSPAWSMRTTGSVGGK